MCSFCKASQRIDRAAGETFTIQSCSRCFLVSYCNEICQKNHREQHRLICNHPAPTRDHDSTRLLADYFLFRVLDSVRLCTQLRDFAAERNRNHGPGAICLKFSSDSLLSTLKNINNNAAILSFAGLPWRYVTRKGLSGRKDALELLARRDEPTDDFLLLLEIDPSYPFYLDGSRAHLIRGLIWIGEEHE